MKEKYDEIGTNYRFFLRWRHATFAGNLIVVYSAISLCLSTYKNSPASAWIIPLIASPIGILLWIIDFRTRDLYHAAIRAGKNLEGNEGGFYTELLSSVVKKGKPKPLTLLLKKKLTHSIALNILLLGSSVLFFLVAVIILLFGDN